MRSAASPEPYGTRTGPGLGPGQLPTPSPGGPPRLWLVAADRSAHLDDLALLDAVERARARELNRPAARRSFVAGHAALRRLLGAYTGIPAAEIRFDRDPCPLCGGPHGRPRLAGETGGSGPAPLHFSLSRARDLTLLAFADRPVGVDIEARPRSSAVPVLARRLHPDERAELAVCPEPARRVALARAWTRKEALLKGLGTGLARPPARDYVGTGPSPARHPYPGWTLTDVRCPPGFHGAVALAAEG